MKRLSRGEKWLSLICAVVVLGLVALGRIWGGQPIGSSWEIPTPSPTPIPNGYDLYLAASAAIVPANPPVDPIIGSRYSIPDVSSLESLPQYSLARRSAWIAKNARVWALFAQAQATRCQAPLERTGIPPGVGDKLRHVAECKIVVANTAKMRGEWNEAAQNLLDVVEMGGHVAQGGAAIAMMNSMVIESVAGRDFDDIVAHLNGEEARHATRRLEKLMRKRRTMAEAMREEKWEGLFKLRYFLRTQPWRNAKAPGYRIFGTEASPAEIAGLLLLSERQILESYNRTADWHIALAQKPYSRAPFAPPSPGNYVNRNFNLDYSNMQFIDARNNTWLSVLLLRLALQAYRVEKGFYPPALEALCPTYLSKIPLDPFGNKTPFHYVRKGDSYLVWSIGTDGKDNKGQPIPRRPGKAIAVIMPDSSGDAIATPDYQTH